LNNDGWEDVVMTSLGGRPQVLLNNAGKAGSKAALAGHFTARHSHATATDSALAFR